MTPEQHRIQELEEKSILKKATALLMPDDWKSYTLLDQLREQAPVDMVCAAFDINRSCYYEHRQRIQRVDAERVALKAQVNELFNKSRSSAGSLTIKGVLNDQGVSIGHFKVRRLMGELGIICKQPSPHKYKQATVERLDIPNRLDREFDVEQPNQGWCGDITYIWAGQHWSYLPVVLDLHARRVVGWAMSGTADVDFKGAACSGYTGKRKHRWCIGLIG